MQDIRTEDWSQYVAPVWPAVINSSETSWKGWETINGALTMPLMVEGYEKKLIKFAIITCRKPN
ncbi:putative tocopherol O-methyltransferase chloroplastic [Bienertia sinuspersici]